MKRVLQILSALLIIVSCSDETISWDDKSRALDYSNSLIGNHVDLVDYLDRVFRSSDYRDMVLAEKDPQIILDRYFSDEFWRMDYEAEADELTVHLGTDETSLTGYLDINHNGKSLLETGAEWTINGIYNRVWYSDNQPEYKEFSFKITNTGENYELVGDAVFNNPNQYFYIECGFNYTFAISEVIVQDETSVNGLPDSRPVWKYKFNGTSTLKEDGRIDSDKKQRLQAVLTVNDLEGYNGNEYYMGIPIYSSGYFNKGRINAVYGTGKDSYDLTLTINGSSWKASLNGNNYTLN